MILLLILLIPCLITKDDQVWSESDFGSDITQQMSFAFLRDDLVDSNVYPEIGDVILYQESYWEVDNTIQTQFFVGIYPPTQPRKFFF